MKGKKSLLFIVVLFILFMAGAYALYDNLKEQMDMPGLSVQQPRDIEDAAGSEKETTETSKAQNVSEITKTETQQETGVSQETETQQETGVSQETEIQQETEISQKTSVPDFQVYDLEGKAVRLSDFYGKPVVLNFWSSRCGPCQSEMPDFEEAYQELEEEIQFLMINVTDGSWDTVESASEFMEEKGYTFPVFYDTDSSASQAYGIHSLPTTFFIDAEGYGVAYGIGAMTGETLKSGIAMIKTP